MRLTSRQRAILELLAKAKNGRMAWHQLPGAGGHAYNMALRGLADRGLIQPWNAESVYVEISETGRSAVAPPRNEPRFQQLDLIDEIKRGGDS